MNVKMNTQATSERCYTLEPLRTRGEQALFCSDMESFESITLTEIELSIDDIMEQRIKHRANDYFQLLKLNRTKIPTDAEILSAEFEIKLHNEYERYCLRLCPPDNLCCHPKLSFSLVDTWLDRRGFVVCN